MRSKITIPIFFLAAFITSLAAQSQNIVYPIEVFLFKDDNSNTSASIPIEVENGATAMWMYLQVNNLNSAPEMSYTLDGGASWRSISPDYTGYEKDEAYGGLGGGFGTVRFLTPITGGFSGSANIQFRYNYQAGSDALGYRIIAMELRSAKDGNNLLQNAAVEEDVTAWSAPVDGTYETGKTLWESTDVLKDKDGNDMIASCSDCHATSGFDLKYFNYSNESIIGRSVFHNFDRAQGKHIAAYIRGLTADASTNGRPWQPPFQPGPNADSDPHEWAAGQGLESVLEADGEMLADIFGSTNPTKADVIAAVNGFDGNTNLREQRLSVQFPDWNEWLPTVHPKDLSGSSSVNWSNINSAYSTAKTLIEGGGVSLANQSATANSGRHNGNRLFQIVNGFIEEISREIAGSIFPPISWPTGQNSRDINVERRKRSVSSYQSVKLFDLIHSNDLQGISSYQGISNAQVETFQWPARNWAVFQNAAHVISSQRGYSYFYEERDDPKLRLKGIYNSSIWYQVQMTLTPGHRRGGEVQPNDWAYNLSHVNKISNASGVMEPARFLQNYMKTAEQRNNGNNPGSSGWNMRELSPWRLWGSNEFPNNQETLLFDELDAYADGLTKTMRNVFLDEVTDILNGFAENAWARISFAQSSSNGSGNNQYHALENRNVVPESTIAPDGSVHFNFAYNRRHETSGGSGHLNGDKDAVEVDVAFSLLDFAKDGAIDEAVFNKYRGWANARWDFTAWPVYSAETLPTFTLEVIGGEGSGAYEEGESVTINANGTCAFVDWTDDPSNVLPNENEGEMSITFSMPAQNISVTANYDCGGDPSVSITAPSNNADIVFNEAFTMTADAFGISEVEFWYKLASETSWSSLGNDISEPYESSIAPVFIAGESYTLRAVGIRGDNITPNLTEEIIVNAIGDGSSPITAIIDQDQVEVRIYPNPFESVINMSGVTPDSRISVFNLSGIIKYEGVGVSTIDLSEFSKGIYVVQIDNSTFKVIKK